MTLLLSLRCTRDDNARNTEVSSRSSLSIPAMASVLSPPGPLNNLQVGPPEEVGEPHAVSRLSNGVFVKSPCGPCKVTGGPGIGVVARESGIQISIPGCAALTHASSISWGSGLTCVHAISTGMADGVGKRLYGALFGRLDPLMLRLGT